MSSPIRPPLKIETIDGATEGRPINTIKVSNGTLSVSGTTATITTGGGGGGSGTVTSVGTSQAFITITDPTTTPNISIGNASGSATGVLTATDWTTFNTKAPNTSSYLTLGTDAGLTNERVLTAGSGISFTDTGAGGTLTIETTGGGGGSPGGSTNDIQVNNGGSFEGAGGFEYNTDSTSSTKYRHVSIDPTETFSPQNDWSLSVFGDTGSTSSIQGALYAQGTFQVFGDSWFLGGFGATKNAIKLFQTNNTSNYMAFAPPSTITTSTILTLPDGDGSTNQVLKTDGSGNLGWTTVSGGGIGGSISDNQIAVGATTADEIEGSADFTYNASTDTLTVGEKIDSSGTSPLQLIAGSSSISILDGGVANHITISPASGRINAQSSTLSVGTDSADATISSSGAYNLTLNTNDGTNSGSIVIEDGVNGQISITPDGTGLVKIDGVGINNSAIATGYILKATSTTEAGWVAESGGGSTPKFSGVKANTNAYYDLSSYPTGWRTTTYTNISETQSSPIYCPFTCGMDLTLGTLGIEVSVAGDAGLNYLLAIYSVDAAGLPDSKLVSATASADATGTQTGTITETSAGDGDLVAGTQYYYAYTQSFDATSNPSLRSAGAQFHGSFTDTTIGTQRQAIRAGTLGTLPATYPGSGIVLGTSIAIVGCTYG